MLQWWFCHCFLLKSEEKNEVAWHNVDTYYQWFIFNKPENKSFGHDIQHIEDYIMERFGRGSKHINKHCNIPIILSTMVKEMNSWKLSR